MIELHVEPRASKNWWRFLKENPPYSIALDGYVSAKPLFDPAGPYANFDHHIGVDRLSTRSTSAQVHLAIKSGLFEIFYKDGEAYCHAFANDADQDVCVSAWLLLNHARVENGMEPRITELVETTDYLDATGGTYPIDPNSIIMQERAWLFEPYTEARKAGLQKMDGMEMREVIDQVCFRITEHVDGRGKMKPTDTSYSILGGGDGWVLVEEHGPDARNVILSGKAKAFVAARDNGNGTWNYVIGRMSPYIHFPIARFYSDLNLLEELDPDSDNCWSGSNTIGGSPRITGSKLSPQVLEQAINTSLSAHRS